MSDFFDAIRRFLLDYLPKQRCLIGNGSISLAQIGSIPHLTEARGKPEMPSKRLPIVSFRVG